MGHAAVGGPVFSVVQVKLLAGQHGLLAEVAGFAVGVWEEVAAQLLVGVAVLRRRHGHALTAISVRLHVEGHPVDMVELAARHYPEVRRGAGGKPDVFWERYGRLLAPLRGQPVSLLELGVRGGGSIRTWCDYFDRATVVGLDFHQCPADWPDGAHYIQGRQEDPAALDQACEVGSPFDVIIDDAAHVGRHAKSSFVHLYDRHLKPGGFYILEDWGTALSRDDWADSNPHVPAEDDGDRFPSFEYGMVGMLKQLIDDLVLGSGPRRIDIHRGMAVIQKGGSSPS